MFYLTLPQIPIPRLESNLGSFFNPFSARTCLVLFKVISLFKFFSLSSNSLFFTKLTISLAKFACANLAVKFYLVDLINSGVLLFIMIIFSNFLFNYINFCVIVSFFDQHQVCLFFSIAVRAVVVAKLVVLGLSPLMPFILALRAKVLAKLVIVTISPLTSFILTLRVVLVAKFVI